VLIGEAGDTHASLRSDAECHHTKGETLAQLRAYAVEKIKQTQPSTLAPADAPSASTAIAVLTIMQHRSSASTLHYASSSDAKQHMHRQKALVAQQIAQAIKQKQQQQQQPPFQAKCSTSS
jgi:SLT domain-containing protein